MPGGTTFFEYIKEEALRQIGPPPDADARERLFAAQTALVLSRATGGRVPAGIAPTTPLAELRLGELFRFPRWPRWPATSTI